MANDGKFLNMTSGRVQQETAVNTSAGAGDAAKIPKLDAAGRLDITMMPVGVSTEAVTLTASEALSAGDFINIHNSSGVKMRKADATASGKEAHGFVLAAVSNGASGTAYMEGRNSGLSGMTVGARQYLATTAGGRTETPPSASGNVVQYLGTAFSATELSFEPEDGVILA